MNDVDFSLHPRLAAGGLVITDLALSRLILKEDARWPWLILVPRRAQIEEIYNLAAADRVQLIEEIHVCARAIADEPDVEKVNVAALGNQVAQLHVHVVGRWQGDDAWPNPVFGVAGRTAYVEAHRSTRIARLLERLHY